MIAWQCGYYLKAAGKDGGDQAFSISVKKAQYLHPKWE